LAVKFFNHAAEFSDVIAFVIPKTFQKRSLQNKLNKYFRLVKNFDLPKNSFTYDGKSYDVPCCFQIWRRSDKPRNINKISLNNDVFSFVKKDKADLAIRRVGGRAGKASLEFKTLSKSSHYFIKLNEKKYAKDIVQFINDIDFSKIVNKTAGVKSLSREELFLTLKQKLFFERY
jgi:hypothetical protein